MEVKNFFLWISDCLSFVKTRSTHLLIFTLGSSKSQSYNFYICCMLLVWWKRFPVDPVLWYLSPKKYFFPFPSIKTYSQCPHTKSTKIENSWLSNDVKCWIQMGRACLYIRNLFHNDKQIKSNLIFQRFWALSIVQATSTCLANGTLASTVPQGDLTIVGIGSFPPNITSLHQTWTSWPPQAL